MFISRRTRTSLLLIGIRRLRLRQHTFQSRVQFIANYLRNFRNRTHVYRRVTSLPDIRRHFSLISITIRRQRAHTPITTRLLSSFFRQIIRISPISIATQRRGIISHSIIRHVGAQRNIQTDQDIFIFFITVHQHLIFTFLRRFHFTHR